MYNDVRRLKTAKIEGGPIWPPPGLNRQLYFAGYIGLNCHCDDLKPLKYVLGFIFYTV